MATASSSTQALSGLPTGDSPGASRPRIARGLRGLERDSHALLRRLIAASRHRADGNEHVRLGKIRRGAAPRDRVGDGHEAPRNAHLAIEVKSPSVTHTVVARAIEDWLNGGAKSPREAIEKRRLKELLDA